MTLSDFFRTMRIEHNLPPLRDDKSRSKLPGKLYPHDIAVIFSPTLSMPRSAVWLFGSSSQTNKSIHTWSALPARAMRSFLTTRWRYRAYRAKGNEAPMVYCNGRGFLRERCGTCEKAKYPLYGNYSIARLGSRVWDWGSNGDPDGGVQSSEGQ